MLQPTAEGPRVAFFGGSFDPPHNGHLAVARAACNALHLDQILFAPVAAQPLKPQGATASLDHRLAMTRLAIADDPAFAISLADAPPPAGNAPSRAPNYTIDTLLRLRAELPAASRLFCLMGADSFLNLRHWHRGAEIPFAAPLIVAARPGQSLADLAAILPQGVSLLGPSAPPAGSGPVEVRCYTLRNSAGDTAALYLLPGLHVDISASQLRRQARAAHDRLPAGHCMLPQPVADYIAAHGLYR